MIKELIKKSAALGISYKSYITLLNHLVSEKKATGIEQTEQRIHFTKLNVARMRRLDKTIVIPEEVTREFQNINRNQTWLVLLESWCADGAQTIPIINKLVEGASNIELKIVLRDEHPGLMDNFLTNGARSIPKLIMLDTEFNVLNIWGPRSGKATRMVEIYKTQNGKIDDVFKKHLQEWYHKDKGEAIIEDLRGLVKQSTMMKTD